MMIAHRTYLGSLKRLAGADWFWAVLVYFAVIFAMAAYAGGQDVDPHVDFIAYYRHAVYWSQLEFSMAISGYWGPLLSILTVPFLPISDAPTVPVRITVILSGVLFVVASCHFFKVCRFVLWQRLLAGLTVALFTANWAWRLFHPDLLLSGLFVLGGALLIAAYERRSLRPAFAAGVVLSLCYLSKTPGLVFAIEALVAFLIVLALLTREVSLRFAGRITVVALAGLAPLAGLWIGVLSLHYGEFTWTTAAERSFRRTIDISVPTQFGMYNVPLDGRFMSWEDPTEILRSETSLDVEELLPKEPFGPADYAQLLWRNATYITQHLIQPSWFALLFLGIAAVCLQRPTVRMLGDPWRLATVLTVCILLLYMVSYAKLERYLLGCFPLLVACGLGLAAWWGEGGARSWRLPALPALGVQGNVLLACITAGVLWFSLAVEIQDILLRPTAHCSIGRRVAERITEVTDTVGPVASVGAQYPGVYTAFYLGVPFYGDEQDLRHIGFLKQHGAELIVSQKPLDEPALDLLTHVPATDRPICEAYVYRLER